MAEDFSQTLTSVVVPTIGALLFAGSVVSVVCQIPPLQSLSWMHLIVSAGLYVLASAAASSLGSWVIRAIFREYITAPFGPMVWGITYSAVWMPVLCLLIREDSHWAIFIPPLIAFFVGAYLRTQCYEIQGQQITDAEQKNTHKLFQALEPRSLLPSMLPAVVASVAFQGGLGAFWLGHSLIAALLFVVCPTIYFWSHPSRSRLPSGLKNSRSERGSVFIPLFAMLLTVIALTPFLRNGGVAARFHSLLEENSETDRMSIGDNRLSLNSPSGSYSGVILLAPPKAHRKPISAPPMKHSILMSRITKPVIIPFDGAYWYFKRPDRRPESDARVVHGNPTKENIRSTDWIPISMEAHQYLGSSLSTDCCKEIRVAIQNADNRGGTISLEVLLKDTGAIGTPAQSLGSLVIPSSEARQIAINRQPVNEVLAFPISAKVHERRFDEITVLIKPAKERSLAGPQVAIQEFRLVP